MLPRIFRGEHGADRKGIERGTRHLHRRRGIISAEHLPRQARKAISEHAAVLRNSKTSLQQQHACKRSKPRTAMGQAQRTSGLLHRMFKLHSVTVYENIYTENDLL